MHAGTPSEIDRDASLVSGMAAGDQVAAGHLYDRHATLLWSIARSIVGDRESAEDVVQEAFLTAWRSASSFDPARASVTTWLTMIVRSRALDVVRARGSRPAVVEADQQMLLERADDRVDTVGSVLEHVVGERVRDAVRSLSADHRAVVALAYFGGYSHSEIASRLSLPLGTVKTRLHAALSQLRGQLDDAGSRAAT